MFLFFYSTKFHSVSEKFGENPLDVAHLRFSKAQFPVTGLKIKAFQLLTPQDVRSRANPAPDPSSVGPTKERRSHLRAGLHRMKKSLKKNKEKKTTKKKKVELGDEERQDEISCPIICGEKQNLEFFYPTPASSGVFFFFPLTSVCQSLSDFSSFPSRGTIQYAQAQRASLRVQPSSQMKISS